MLDLFKRLFKSENSGEIAKNRLKVVIMQDRTTFTPFVMDNLKRDMIEVFKKYLEIDDDGLEFALDTEDDSVGLSINIPIKKVKSDEEVRDDTGNEE